MKPSCQGSSCGGLAAEEFLPKLALGLDFEPLQVMCPAGINGLLVPLGAVDQIELVVRAFAVSRPVAFGVDGEIADACSSWVEDTGDGILLVGKVNLTEFEFEVSRVEEIEGQFVRIAFRLLEHQSRAVTYRSRIERWQDRAFCEESCGEGKKTQEQGARQGCFGRFTKPLPCHTRRLRIRRRAETNRRERSLDFIA